MTKPYSEMTFDHPMAINDSEVILTDGEIFDRYGDMLTPTELVRALDRLCWQEQLIGVYLILRERFENAPDGDPTDDGHGCGSLSRRSSPSAAKPADGPTKLNFAQHKGNTLCAWR